MKTTFNRTMMIEDLTKAVVDYIFLKIVSTQTNRESLEKKLY